MKAGLDHLVSGRLMNSAYPISPMHLLIWRASIVDTSSGSGESDDTTSRISNNYQSAETSTRNDSCDVHVYNVYVPYITNHWPAASLLVREKYLYHIAWSPLPGHLTVSTDDFRNQPRLDHKAGHLSFVHIV